MQAPHVVYCAYLQQWAARGAGYISVGCSMPTVVDHVEPDCPSAEEQAFSFALVRSAALVRVALPQTIYGLRTKVGLEKSHCPCNSEYRPSNPVRCLSLRTNGPISMAQAHAPICSVKVDADPIMQPLGKLESLEISRLDY